MSRPQGAWGEARALLVLAVPLGLAQAGQSSMGLVDIAVVGQLSEAAQSATGIGNGLFLAASTLGLGVMLALDPLIAQAVGAGETARGRSLLWQGVWLSLLLTAVLAPVLWLAPWVLGPFEVAPRIAELGRGYTWARIGQLPFFFFAAAARAYLQAVGRGAPVFWAMVAANVLNFGLAVSLVFGWGPIPALGVVGAGLATVGSAALQALLLAWACLGALRGSDRGYHPPTTRLALKVGAPIGLQLGAEVGIFVVVAMLAGRLGEVAGASHQIALTWCSVSFSMAWGIGGAAAARVGLGVGFGDLAWVRRAGTVALVVGTVWMASSSVWLWAWRHELSALMSASLEVRSAAAALLVIAAWFQISDGLQAVGAGVLRGAGDTRSTFIANLIGHWAIGMPVALWLAQSQGLAGLWWGLTLGLTIVAVLLVGRFIWLARRPIAALSPSH